MEAADERLLPGFLSKGRKETAVGKRLRNPRLGSARAE